MVKVLGRVQEEPWWLGQKMRRGQAQNPIFQESRRDSGFGGDERYLWSAREGQVGWLQP